MWIIIEISAVLYFFSSIFRDSDSEWNGVQAAPSRHCGIRDGLNGWSAEPCFQCLHTGNTPRLLSDKCLKIQHSFSESQKRKGKTLGENHQTITVVRNISVCDDCLVACFLTSDDILCPPPPPPEASEAGNRISPQAKPWPDFFNDTAINPWNAHASKNSKASMKKQIDHIYLHIWLCLQAAITAMIETGPVQAATFL